MLHNFKADLGYAYRNHKAEFLQGQGNKPYKYIVYLREDSDSSIINNSINSVFASLDYNFKQRYFFNGGIRYDALSPSIEKEGTLLRLLLKTWKELMFCIPAFRWVGS